MASMFFQKAASFHFKGMITINFKTLCYYTQSNWKKSTIWSWQTGDWKCPWWHMASMLNDHLCMRQLPARWCRVKSELTTNAIVWHFEEVFGVPYPQFQQVSSPFHNHGSTITHRRSSSCKNSGFSLDESTQKKATVTECFLILHSNTFSEIWKNLWAESFRRWMMFTKDIMKDKF